MKKMDNIPNFKNKDEEQKFWATHSPLDYFDSRNIKRVSFHNLKPSLKSISIRLPEDMIAKLKTLAHKSRGRNAGHPAPPAQIPACATNAPGSCLR